MDHCCGKPSRALPPSLWQLLQENDRRSQARSLPKPTWGQIRSSVRATSRGVMLSLRSQVGRTLPVALGSSFPSSPSVVSSRPVLCRDRGCSPERRGSCKTRERTPDVPPDRWLKGETTLLDPRWPHGSSAGVAQRDPCVRGKLGATGGCAEEGGEMRCHMAQDLGTAARCGQVWGEDVQRTP